MLTCGVRAAGGESCTGGTREGRLVYSTPGRRDVRQYPPTVCCCLVLRMCAGMVCCYHISLLDAAMVLGPTHTPASFSGVWRLGGLCGVRRGEVEYGGAEQEEGRRTGSSCIPRQVRPCCCVLCTRLGGCGAARLPGTAFAYGATPTQCHSRCHACVPTQCHLGYHATHTWY